MIASAASWRSWNEHLSMSDCQNCNNKNNTNASGWRSLQTYTIYYFYELTKQSTNACQTKRRKDKHTVCIYFKTILNTSKGNTEILKTLFNFYFISIDFHSILIAVILLICMCFIICFVA